MQSVALIIQEHRIKCVSRSPNMWQSLESIEIWRALPWRQRLIHMFVDRSLSLSLQTVPSQKKELRFLGLASSSLYWRKNRWFRLGESFERSQVLSASIRDDSSLSPCFVWPFRISRQELHRRIVVLSLLSDAPSDQRTCFTQKLSSCSSRTLHDPVSTVPFPHHISFELRLQLRYCPTIIRPRHSTCPKSQKDICRPHASSLHNRLFASPSRDQASAQTLRTVRRVRLSRSDLFEIWLSGRFAVKRSAGPSRTILGASSWHLIEMRPHDPPCIWFFSDESHNDCECHSSWDSSGERHIDLRAEKIVFQRFCDVSGCFWELSLEELGPNTLIMCTLSFGPDKDLLTHGLVRWARVSVSTLSSSPWPSICKWLRRCCSAPSPNWRCSRTDVDGASWGHQLGGPASGLLAKLLRSVSVRRYQRHGHLPMLGATAASGASLSNVACCSLGRSTVDRSSSASEMCLYPFGFGSLHFMRSRHHSRSHALHCTFTSFPNMQVECSRVLLPYFVEASGAKGRCDGSTQQVGRQHGHSDKVQGNDHSIRKVNVRIRI